MFPKQPCKPGGNEQGDFSPLDEAGEKSQFLEPTDVIGVNMTDGYVRQLLQRETGLFQSLRCEMSEVDHHPDRTGLEQHVGLAKPARERISCTHQRCLHDESVPPTPGPASNTVVVPSKPATRAFPRSMNSK